MTGQGLGVARTVEDIMTSTGTRGTTLVSPHTTAAVGTTATHDPQTTPGVRSPVTEVETDAPLNKVVFHVYLSIASSFQGYYFYVVILFGDIWVVF